MHYNMVKRASRPYLEEIANRAHEMPEVYKCINTLQETAFTVSTPVYQVMKTCYHKGLDIAGLPGGKLEEPNKPFDIATNEEARKDYSRRKKAICDYNATIDSKALLTVKIFSVADTYEQFDEFYFPMQYDWRSRIYPVPEGLNYQQNDLAKGLLQFKNGRALGSQEAIDKLAIHGANMFGKDKDTLENRIKWVQENEEAIIATAEDPHNHYDFWANGASEPVQFLAFCFEWNNFCKANKSLEFISHTICYSDCTNSGLQIFSALLKDEVGGKAVNLIPKETVQDVYGEVAKKTLEFLEKEPDSLLKDIWQEYGITRKTTKKVTMCIVYGLTQFSCREYIEEHLEEMEEEGIPIPFSTDINPIPGTPNIFQGTAYLSKIIWKALGEVISSAKDAMKWLQDVSKLVADNGMSVVWTTPTNFIVHMTCPVLQTKRVNTYMGEKIFRPKTRTYTPDIRKTSIAVETNKINKRRVANSIAPCFVHALDGSLMMKAVCKASDVGIENFACVHDSFGCLAPDVATMNKSLREAFVEIFNNNNLLEDFLKEIEPQIHESKRDKIPAIPKQGSLNILGVLKSLYFCS